VFKGGATSWCLVAIWWRLYVTTCDRISLCLSLPLTHSLSPYLSVSHSLFLSHSLSPSLSLSLTLPPYLSPHLSLSQEELRTGERAVVRFCFIKHPEYLRLGAKLLFREGVTKGIGHVTRLLPDAQNQDQNQNQNQNLQQDHQRPPADRC